MENIFVKTVKNNIKEELNSVGFESVYIDEASKKYKGQCYKIYNLKPYEANILKQLCLSLGFDCGVNRETITCKCEKTNAIIFATDKQLTLLIKKLRVQPFKLKFLADELEKLTNKKLIELKIQNKVFDWSRPYIMGIVNVTPDSFSDGGIYYDTNMAYNHVLQLIKDGADIIDIGGESTRPNAAMVTTEDEIKRVIPLIKMIRENNIDIPISIDTRNHKTAKAAIEAGADIVNDVSGLDYDENLMKYVARNNLPVIIMHSDKVPASSDNFTNKDTVEEVYISLKNKIDKLLNLNFDIKNIIIDVGIGFGKSAETNFELLKRMEEFESLGCPILLGISRKSFIRNTFNCNFDDSDNVTALYSSMVKGVNIHRVHNPALTKKYINYSSKLL